MTSPRIVEIEPKTLIGSRVQCSLQEDKTGALWQQFMPKRKNIKHRVNQDYISAQNFDGPLDMQNFTEETQFERWAAVEVAEIEDIPEGLEPLKIEGGKYAVFIHRGLLSDFHKTKNYIFDTWLPASGFSLDDRVHFEVMGEKYYGPTDANSEEEIWIPVR
jgi:AraC family transcriptional regulator